MACRIVGQHRSTQRHEPPEAVGDSALRAELRAFAKAHPRSGYRRAHAVLRREGHHSLNRKKVQRLWREGPAGARPAQQATTSRCLHDPGGSAGGRLPESPVGVGLPVRCHRHRPDHQDPELTDEFTRESLCDLVAHSIDADVTVAALDNVAAARGAHPDFIRCDNAPELTAAALRD